jgi:uncharacterized protein YndB with AHSA1/START domain
MSSITIRRLIPAARERVFEAWTKPEELKRWSAPGDMVNPVVEVDLQTGGRYRIDMRAPDGREHRVTGVYRVVDPPNRLVYTWFWETNPALGEMLVSVDFLDRGSQTEVVLEHSQLVSPDAATPHERGWTGCLLKLECLFN